MENNTSTIEDLLEFAKVAERAIEKVKRDVTEIKKGLTPEQRAELDRQLEGNDLDEAKRKLTEALDNFKKTTFSK